MRTIFFFLFIACVTTSLFSQKPTAKEIETQKQEALKDAKQQVADLKKDIALSKTANEDPEAIKEMEKQLKILEQMVTMLAGTNLSGNRIPQTLSPSKTAEPKYISPFVPITLTQTVAAPTKENAKDQLLWYTGKKINANTLITVSGVIVQYNRQRNIVIVQTDKRTDTPYYGLLATLAKTSQMKKEFAIGMAGMTNSFLMWPEIKKAYDEYDFFKNRYYDIAKNTIDVPAPQPNIILDHWYQLLKNYMSNLPPIQNLTRPPKRPNDLCKCDPDDRSNYEDHLAAWLENDFWKEEQQTLSYLNAIYTQGMAINAGRPVPPNLKADIVTAYNLVIKRSKQKLSELSRLYQFPDIQFEEALVMATISFEKLLMQTFADVEEPSTVSEKGNAYAVIEDIKDMIMNNKVFEPHMQNQLIARNYNVVLDYSLFLSHEYNKQLLSPSYNIKDNFFQTWMESLKKFNRFTLTIGFDFDYRIESENSRAIKAIGTLEAKPVIVSLARSSCKWHLYLSDVDHAGINSNEDLFYIPVKVINGTKWIYRDPNPPITLGYSGPADMALLFPEFELTFCNTTGTDTIFMDKLRFSEKVANAYMAAHPKIDFGKEYSLDIFQYSNKMFVSALKTKENAGDLISMAGKMMNIQNNTQMPGSTNDQNLDKLLMDFTMNQKRRVLQQGTTPITNTEKTILKFNAHNGIASLISNSYDVVDPGDPDRQAGIKLELGIIRIKAVHTPQ
jgi:hypothetical protein